jgi:hypothetical protein
MNKDKKTVSFSYIPAHKDEDDEIRAARRAIKRKLV